jgi:hypothetical protein
MRQTWTAPQQVRTRSMQSEADSRPRYDLTPPNAFFFSCFASHFPHPSCLLVFPVATASPTAIQAVVETPVAAPSATPVEPDTEDASSTGGFGAGPSVAIAVGGTVLIASAIFLGRRRKTKTDENSQSMGQSADADTL